ncbi:sigma-70 region 4 domain-containing protein, partial [Actinoplanes sp. NPDC051633]|uniref:sigma-70 region 4 domain-containing protein n=1 Tax=Actinoplanes sp. NPDC051633 TaxID=3155670 RepID=UPI0034300320
MLSAAWKSSLPQLPGPPPPAQLDRDGGRRRPRDRRRRPAPDPALGAGRLPRRDRAIVILRYFEDYTVEQAAQLVDLSESACGICRRRIGWPCSGRDAPARRGTPR